jgi:hypothetical protein
MSYLLYVLFFLIAILIYQHTKTLETFENTRDNAQGHIRRIHRNIRHGATNASSTMGYKMRKQLRQFGF